MTKALLGGQEIEVDEDGFIQEPEKWNAAIAEDLAKTESVDGGMTADHWLIVNWIREYYLEFDVAPPIRKLVKHTFDLARIYELFPSGPAKGACKVAGLPKPTGCV